MDWITDLESTCASLGTSDGNTYVREEDCLECVKDLIRFLRRDDDNHELRRRLGQIQVVQSDLIPILKSCVPGQDDILFDMVLRLLVNLTNPELLLFREELPEEKTTRNYFLQLQQHRQAYKDAFVDDGLWKKLKDTLGTLLFRPQAERLEDDQLIIERILILVRNILQVPRDSSSESRIDSDISKHDQILWVLHKSEVQDLLLYIASSEEESQYCLHALEIISLMFREQDPKHLAAANFQRSKEEKEEDEKSLLQQYLREKESKKQRMAKASTRHSRFGGTYTISNMASISEKKIISHRPLQNLNSLDFDREKRHKKLAVSKQTPGEEAKRRSTLSVRLFLKEFCIEFLSGAYNNLMLIVKDSLNRQRAQQNDESYYLWAIRFFMEFNRSYEFRAEVISETLNKPTFHYIQQQIEVYKDNFEHEKRNRPKYLLWSRRMHLALRAYQELLFTLVAMDQSKNPEIVESSKRLKVKVFYEPEYRELCLMLFSIYTPAKMSNGFLKDLIETSHVFLKIMEKMSAGKHLIIGKKIRKKLTTGKKSKKSGKVLGETGLIRESKEDAWELVSSQISELLQEDDAPSLPAVQPFDSTLDIEMEQQKLIALYRIQKYLAQPGRKQPAKALALLRAAREVWPEGDVFGEQDAEPEDEFMTLREILFAEMEKPANMPTEDGEEDDAPSAAAPASTATTQGEGGEGENDAGHELDEEDEFEEEEDDGPEIETVTQDQELDFNSLVLRFANKNVCQGYARCFKDYRTNSDFLNHCIIKMFHRISWDCKLPALLYQVSILRIFQNINRDRKLAVENKSLKEMHKFASFLLRQFFDSFQNNPKLFMEACFWKTTKEAEEVGSGQYESTADRTARQKASFWSEDDEETLTRFFAQYKEMKEKGEEDVDIVDSLTDMFEKSGKTRRQIIKKLKQLELIHDIKEISSKKPKSGRQRKRKDNGDDSGNDDANFPTRETDALGNPLFKSKQFIEDDDSSSDDEPPKADVNPESKSSQRPQDNSNPRGRRISDMDSSSDDDDSADKTEESGAAVPAAAPSPAARSRSSSPLTSFVATPSQSQRTGRSRRSSFNTSLDQTRNSSRSSSRSSSPVSRRSLDTSRNTSRLQLSSPISRDGGGHSSPDSRRRSPSTSFAYSPSVTSRRSSPVSAVATPISSQTPKRARQASPQSSAKRAKKKLKTSFVDSSSDEDAKEDDTHENSPLKKKADEVENDEAQSPIKTKSKRRAMVLDSDSD